MFEFYRQLKSWVSKKKLKGKQSSKPSKNSQSSLKKSKLPPENLKSLSEASKSPPEIPKSVPVNPIPSAKSLDLIDPAIIFTPERKKDNSNTLVSDLKQNLPIFNKQIN